MRKAMTAVVVVSIFLAVTEQLLAQEPNLSIYELQYTENSDGSSYYDQQYVNCNGGIVIHKYLGSRHRLVLYDPNYPDGWGGISVKGDFETNPMPFGEVQLGDWICLDNVFVDETGKARGNTDLIFKDISFYPPPISIGNSLPEPLVVDVNDIAVVYDPIEQTCYVTDHRAEKYEAMYLQVRVVTVGDVNVGKDKDNYSLASIEDPNIYCWASDYMNIDNPDDKTPHPIVESGLKLCSVSGILEQYTKLSLSDGWDYYQLLTTKLEDFQVEQIADFDNNCGVDFADFSIFAGHWLQSGCVEPDWCGGADLIHDANAVVDMFDLFEFTKNWLEGK